MLYYFRNHREPIIIFSSIVLAKLCYILSGLFLNPAIFGFATPIIVGIILFVGVVYSGVSLVRLAESKFRAPRLLVNALLSMATWLLVLVPNLPDASQSARYRLSTIEQAEYMEIMKIAALAYAKYGNGDKLFWKGDEGYEEFLAELKSNHEFFRINRFPIDVLYRTNEVTIEWASGLTGGYSVTIFDPQIIHKPMFSEGLIYVHDNVYLRLHH